MNVHTSDRAFMAAHGRLLDRRRLEFLLDEADPDAVLAALDGYRNPDGGYGWGLEPDLRAPESQPAAAMHALEVLAEIGPATSPRSLEVCDWLEAHSLPDGGVPFALTVADPAGCAPVWLDPDTTTSSLQMTAQVAANAHLVARHDPAVRSHPWLARATEWCLSAVRELRTTPHAHELLFAIRFLDVVADAEPDALTALDRLGRVLPADGIVAVQGGAEGEVLRPLDFAPHAEGPARHLFSDDVINRELHRLAADQQSDGGWTVDFTSASPAASLEWRGYATVQAVRRLRGHDL
ncbi:MAG TPA: hypothetical protein VFZ68_07115 [Acidimicrobiales bacterium]